MTDPDRDRPPAHGHRSPSLSDPEGGSGWPTPLLLLALGAAELLLLAVLGWWPGVPLPFPGFALWAGAFAVYAAGAWAIRRGPGGLGVIWGLAVVMRLALLPLAPELSDDVYRYLWDGHVQLSGINPYEHAPADPALDPLTTEYRHLVNNPTVPTIYPPVAQVAFLFIALLGGTVLQAKLLWTGFDLLTGWLVGRVARQRGRSRRMATLLYLWSPLLIVETAWNGHLEALGLFGLMLVLVLAGRPALSGMALAWATLTKLAPVAALPPLTRRLGWRFGAAFAGAAILLYLPYAGAGVDLFGGLGTYTRHWRFNEGAFALLEAVLPGGVGPRVAAGAIVLTVVGWATWRRWTPERSLFWILATGFVLSPTLHPWYALWILPLAAVRGSRPWILFTGTVFVGYWGLPIFLETGIWPLPLWGKLVVWLPVAALLVWDFFRRPGPDPTRLDPGRPSAP